MLECLQHTFSWRTGKFSRITTKYCIRPNYCTMRLGFSKFLGKLGVKYVSTYTEGTLKQRSAKDLSNDAYVMFLCFLFSDILYKSIYCGYLFELCQQVEAIQISTHSICLYKVDKKYTGCNLKTTNLLDCALMEVCAVIRLNTILLNKSSGARSNTT